LRCVCVLILHNIDERHRLYRKKRDCAAAICINTLQRYAAKFLEQKAGVNYCMITPKKKKALLISLASAAAFVVALLAVLANLATIMSFAQQYFSSSRSPTPGALICERAQVPALPAVPPTATNEQQDTLLQAFEERLTYLVSTCQLRALKTHDPLIIQVEYETVSTITHLNGTRNDELFQFLRRMQLIGKENAISFAGQDLSGAHLNVCHRGCQGSDGIDLRYLDFTGTNLSGANLNRAEMMGAHLENANLTNGTDIGNVDFTDADLRGARTDNPEVFSQADVLLCRTTMPDGTIVSQCPA
jgi:hypothetical protein